MVVIGAGREAELSEQVGHVLFDSSLAYDELRGDRLVRSSLRHEREHLPSWLGWLPRLERELHPEPAAA
jgi:hypothetical protein